MLHIHLDVRESWSDNSPNLFKPNNIAIVGTMTMVVALPKWRPRRWLVVVWSKFVRWITRTSWTWNGPWVIFALGYRTALTFHGISAVCHVYKLAQVCTASRSVVTYTQTITDYTALQKKSAVVVREYLSLWGQFFLTVIPLENPACVPRTGEVGDMLIVVWLLTSILALT